MADYSELLRLLSIPRPNGSVAERATAQALHDWLTARGIDHQAQSFRLYPYFNEALGVWLIGSRTLLALAVWLGWGWATLPIAIVALLGGTLDVARGIPLVTWPAARRGQNLLIEFTPPQPQREIVLAAHYDSKTEWLDHQQRAFFTSQLRLGIYLTIGLGLLGPVQALTAGSPFWSPLLFWLGVAISLPLLGLAWGLGLNLTVGRWSTPSQGAVDNGAVCAILLGLAEQLARSTGLQHSKVVIALFGGEEVSMQGSRTYVRLRAWPLPTMVVNLELMAQDGPYVIWQRDGTALRQILITPALSAALAQVVADVTGPPPQGADLINSDAVSFLAAGIPATVLGSSDKRLGLGGLHRPADNLSRVIVERLPEGVAILAEFIRRWEAGELQEDAAVLDF
jgi:acetylornithine deacetylase/succinyl-diaminopimelate desuccinylase-like protein